MYAAQSLRRAPVRATLIDRRNFHLFQPLLYQVATGGLSPADIASPLRSVLRSQRNVCVLQGEVSGIDAAGHRLLLGDASIEYDTLIVATGASHHEFGHADWEPLAPGLKSIEDATEIRRRVFDAFERAEREPDAGRRREWMTLPWWAAARRASRWQARLANSPITRCPRTSARSIRGKPRCT